MRLEQLEYLLEISKVCSINSASINLHISQQSLSKSIQNLEDELEVTLFERSNKGVTLTPEGQRVADKATKIIAELSELKSTLQATAKPTHDMHGQLNIMHTNLFDFDKMSVSLHDFSKAYPNIKVRIYEKSIYNMVPALLSNEIDLGLLALPNDFNPNELILGQDLTNLLMFPLAEDRLLAAVSKQSALAQRKSISIGSLLKYPLLLLQHDFNERLDKMWINIALSQFGTPNFTLTTNNTELYLRAIANDTGIGFCTQSTKKWFHSALVEDIVTLPIRPPIRLFQMYLLNKNRPVTMEIRAYLPFLCGTPIKN